MYLAGIGKTPLLTAEGEVELASPAATGKLGANASAATARW